MQISVNDRHVGHQLVVGKRILDSGLFVGDNGERSNLGTGTGRGRDCNEVSLFTHLGESIDTLTDIREAHSHIHEVCFRMLVKNPHDLAGVHSGTAAESDNHVRLKRHHLSGTLTGTCQRRVGRYVVERGVRDSHAVQLIGDALGKAVLVQEAVGYDKCLFLAHNGFQFVKSNRETALLKINLFRCSEPKHIFSPLRNGLDIDQVLDAYVLRYTVSAPRTATKGERGSQLEVVKVADTALRRGSVDQNTAGFHMRSKEVELFFFGGDVQVNRRGVTVTAVGDQVLCLCHSVLKGLCVVHGKNGRKLFMCKLLGQLYALYFADQDLGVFGSVHTGKLCDVVSRLTDDLCVQCAVDQDGLSDLLGLLGVQEVATSVGKFFLYLVVYLIQYDHRLLGCADHTVVKGLGVDDRVDSQQDVCGVVDDSGRVSGANAQSRLAGGVSRLDHAGTTGGKDDVGFFHNQVGEIKRRNVDPADDSLRSTCRHSGFQYDLCRRNGGFLCSWVRADDDTVSGFQTDQRLENCGRGGVGGRNDGAHDTDRLGDLLDAVRLVLFQNAAGLRVSVSVIDIFGSVVVFDYLIFHDAHAGLFNRHFGKRDSCLVGCGSGGKEDLIYLFLCVGGKNRLCLSYFCQLLLQRFNAVHDSISFLVHFQGHLS